MCLLVFAYRVHRGYRLVLAGNRDEFYRRASAPCAFWDDYPEVLAGRDLEKGGSWMGVTRAGRLATLTNFRDPAERDPLAPSRGLLVSGFLTSEEAPQGYLARLAKECQRYNDFNLFLGDGDSLWYFSSRNRQLSKLGPGIYGVSNHLLDTPWPKVVRAKRRLASLAADDAGLEPEALFALLADREPAPDSELPDTGIDLQRERDLSPVFVSTPNYGTRASTLIIADQWGQIDFMERSFDPSGHAMETRRYVL